MDPQIYNSTKWEFDKMHDENRLEEIIYYDDEMAFGIFEGPKFFPHALIFANDVDSINRIKIHLTLEKQRVLERKKRNPRARDVGQITFRKLVSLLPADTTVLLSESQKVTLRQFLDSIGKKVWRAFGEVKNGKNAKSVE